MTQPGAPALLALARARYAASETILTLGVPAGLPGAHALTPEKVPKELAARVSDPVAAVVAAWPARSGPLIQLLEAMRDALTPEGSALIADLVWQTAPTPELMRVFSPATGLERVRPIEGYEMQIEHAGFDILERGELPRDAWMDELEPAQAEAVRADARGAAKVATWVIRPSTDA